MHDSNSHAVRMTAVMLTPGVPGSVSLDDIAEPATGEGAVLVEVVAVGICGTDLEIVAGASGSAPSGADRLILGHESLGRVVDAPVSTGLAVGDLVVAMVRHPDPLPCVNCAVSEWDMCRNGGYTEHGIKDRHGFARERYRIDSDRLVRIDRSLGVLGVLLEPTSVVAKAWEVVESIRARVADTTAEQRRVLILGAGPIGLLAALLGRQRGCEVHVLDRVTDGPKPELVRALGATYVTGSVSDAGEPFDVIIECTGVGQLVVDATARLAGDGVLCLTGVSSGGHRIEADLGAINRGLVLENGVIVGSVNANARHYRAAAAALAAAEPSWLARIISRHVPIDRWSDALVRQPDDVKAVLRFGRLETD